MLQTKTLHQTANLQSLESSLQHFTPKVVEKVVWLFRPFLPEGVAMPDVALVLQLLLHVLIDAGTQVIGSNWQRHEEALDDLGLREDRDGAVTGVRPKMFRIRDLFRGALGPKGPRLLALEDGVETAPMPLLYQATYVHDRLLDPKLLEGLELWAPVDPVKLAGQLDPELTMLRTSTQGLTAERRSTEESLLALREVQATSQRSYVQGAKIVEGFFRLVGMDEEADRIRLARRQGTTPPPDGVPLPGVTAAEDAAPEAAIAEEVSPEEEVAEAASPEGAPAEAASPEGTVLDAQEPKEG